MNKRLNMMKWAKDLFPICRSITGEGNRETIRYIRENINKKFILKKFKSKSKFFDWEIPLEWKIDEAYIKNSRGKRICDFKKNNLHVVNYSVPINKVMNFKKLDKHLYTLKDKPNSIPYVTSYYKKNWGFCIKYNEYKKLNKKEKFKVVIKSKHFKGVLDYAEMVIKGKSKKEILIISYICHPSLANNELSGPLVLMALSTMLKKSKYTVRLVLIPETIGAVCYIKKNLKNLQENLVAGFNLTCVGDSGPFTLISSINENTYADKIAERILSENKKFKKLSFLKRGSNERQFGCQNLKLPFVSICRTRFGDFKEYHTSDDNLSIINNKNLSESVKNIFKIIKEIQKNKIFIKRIFCEPFLTKHNLFIFSKKINSMLNKKTLDICALVDKDNDLTEIARKIKVSKREINTLANILTRKKILSEWK